MTLQYDRNFHVHVNATSYKPNMNIVIYKFFTSWRHSSSSEQKHFGPGQQTLILFFYKLVGYFAALKGQCVVSVVWKGVDCLIEVNWRCFMVHSHFKEFHQSINIFNTPDITSSHKTAISFIFPEDKTMHSYQSNISIVFEFDVPVL